VNQGVEQTPSVILNGLDVLATEREEGDREMELWRPSRHGVRSGRGGLRVLQMLLKSGWFSAMLSGAMISMGRLLEKLGPQR
jgi:hypothetical protein